MGAKKMSAAVQHHRGSPPKFLATSASAPGVIKVIRVLADAPRHRSTGAENRAADPHMGGAELDRRLEVGAHAHAQLLKLELLGEFCQEREVDGRLLVDRRKAHQPGDGK